MERGEGVAPMRRYSVRKSIAFLHHCTQLVNSVKDRISQNLGMIRVVPGIAVLACLRFHGVLSEDSRGRDITMVYTIANEMYSGNLA